jgi:hypothetical protein
MLETFFSLYWCFRGISHSSFVKRKLFHHQTCAEERLLYKNGFPLSLISKTPINVRPNSDENLNLFCQSADHFQKNLFNIWHLVKRMFLLYMTHLSSYELLLWLNVPCLKTIFLVRRLIFMSDEKCLISQFEAFSYLNFVWKQLYTNVAWSTPPTLTIHCCFQVNFCNRSMIFPLSELPCRTE